MESLILVPSNALDAATQIVDLGEERGVRLRLIGGLAFKKLCPSSMDPRYFRENKDIDLMGRRGDSQRIVKIMETLGYKPRELFNKLNMGQRLIYYDMGNSRRIDLFLDEFVMCHKFNFKENILAGMYTLPITQLLMTKLQVVEKTEKEYKDMVVAFHDFDVTHEGDGIRGDEIADLCSKDWGLYTTFWKTLESLRGWTEAHEVPGGEVVLARIQKLMAEIESAPKSFGWKMRARIGERTKWYDLPNADGDPMLH